MSDKILYCQYCGKPMKMDVAGNPKVAHMQCVYDAFAERRKQVQSVNPPKK